MRRALRTVGILLDDAVEAVATVVLTVAILVAVFSALFGVGFLVGYLASLVMPGLRASLLLGASPIDTAMMGLTVIAAIVLAACLCVVARGFARMAVVAWHRAERES